MLLEPDERETSVPDVADELGAVERSGNSVVIVAESGRELAGYVELYERMGFSVEGRRSQCLVIDGEFVDEFYMAVTSRRASGKILRRMLRDG